MRVVVVLAPLGCISLPSRLECTRTCARKVVTNWHSAYCFSASLRAPLESVCLNASMTLINGISVLHAFGAKLKNSWIFTYTPCTPSQNRISQMTFKNTVNHRKRTMLWTKDSDCLNLGIKILSFIRSPSATDHEFLKKRTILYISEA
jgi:hypothetical protein